MSLVGFNLRAWSSVLVFNVLPPRITFSTPAQLRRCLACFGTYLQTLQFSFKQATSTAPLSTKREALQETPQVFDPLGLLQPVTVAAKILIQELSKEGIDWDEPLPPSLDQKWRAVAKKIGDATRLEFPRRYFTSDVSVDSSDTELQSCFCWREPKSLRSHCLPSMWKPVITSHGEVTCCSNKEETHPSRAKTYGSFNNCMFSFTSSRTSASYKSHVVWQPNCTSLAQKHQVSEGLHQHLHPTPMRRPQRDAGRRAIRRNADWAMDICVPLEDVQ